MILGFLYSCAKTKPIDIHPQVITILYIENGDYFFNVNITFLLALRDSMNNTYDIRIV